jgi:hypothetical protein
VNAPKVHLKRLSISQLHAREACEGYFSTLFFYDQEFCQIHQGVFKKHADIFMKTL